MRLTVRGILVQKTSKIFVSHPCVSYPKVGVPSQSVAVYGVRRAFVSRWLRLGSGLALVLLSGMAMAQTKATPTYSDLVSAVKAKLPDGQNAEELGKLVQQYRNSESWIADDVYVNLGLEDDQWTGDQGYQSWSAGATVSLNLPSQKRASGQVSDQTAQLRTATQQYWQWLAEQKVRQLVWTLKKAKIKADYIDQALLQTQKLSQTVEQSYQAGEKPKVDWLLAQKTLSRLQQQQQLSHSNLQIAESSYHYWTGYSQLPAHLKESAPSLNNAMQPPETHPYLAWLKAKADTAGSKTKLAQTLRSGNPMLHLGTKSEKDKYTSENQYLVAQISVPLGFNPGQKRHIADLNQQMVEERVTWLKARQTFDTRWAETVRQYQARKQMQQMAVDTLSLSKQALALEEQAYRSGDTSIQNLLLIRQTYQEDELNAQLAQVAVNESIAKLNELLGVTLP